MLGDPEREIADGGRATEDAGQTLKLKEGRIAQPLSSHLTSAAAADVGVPVSHPFAPAGLKQFPVETYRL